MEGVLVSAAVGVLKSVLGKLATLLGDQYKHFRQVRKEIGFLTRELVAMEAFIYKMSMEEDTDIQDKVWINEVQELFCEIEDGLDFMDHVEDKYSKPGFVKKIKYLLDRTKDHRRIGKTTEDLKKQIIEVAERRKRYTVR